MLAKTTATFVGVVYQTTPFSTWAGEGVKEGVFCQPCSVAAAVAAINTTKNNASY